jgi:ketosteroid isomerase-like protein
VSSKLEVVRQAVDAFLRGDFDRSLEFADPDIVSFRAPPLPDPQTYDGPAGVMQMYKDWTAEFGEFDMEVTEVEETGGRVIVEMIQRGSGRSSGAPVTGHFWFVFTVAGGSITRQEVYGSREQAFEAAGG